MSKLKKVEIDDLKWWVRKDTLDEYVIKEARAYGKRVEFRSKDVWLDAGANIGAFACRAAKKVSQVIAIEPAPDNLEVLEANIELQGLDNIVVIPKALVGDDSKRVDLYLNQAKNPGSHSQFVQRGREVIHVPAININKVIRKYDITKFKMDVEGAEYSLIMGIKTELWSELSEFVLEYHFAALKDKDHKMFKKLMSKLTKEGFNFNGHGPKWNDGMKNWHTLLDGAK